MRVEAPRIRGALAGVALVAAACSGNLRETPALAEVESHAAEAQQEYVIGASDVLKVSVWQQRDLSLEDVVVRPDGKISVPLLDDVVAAGLTPAELKTVLVDGLSEFITAPHVTVVVREVRSKRVYVLGEVAREGILMLSSGMRVVDAIASSGGFGTFADRSSIKVFRDQNGHGPVELEFDYDSYVEGENLEQNVLLLPGDRIVVPEQSPFWR